MLFDWKNSKFQNVEKYVASLGASNAGIIIGSVKDTIYDPNDTKWIQDSSKAILGQVLFVPVGQSSKQPLIAKPISTSQVYYPVKGELIVCIKLIFKGTDRDYNTDYFYLCPLNSSGNPNFNGLSSFVVKDVSDRVTQGDTFLPRDISPIISYEGDLIFQSRWGSSLRFGSTVKNPNTRNSWSDSGTDGDPIVILSTESSDSRINLEEPNRGTSMIWLTSQQRIPLREPNRINSSISSISNYSGPQAIITSGRLTFISEEDSIVIASKKEIGLTTSKWKLDVSQFSQIVLDLLGEIVSLIQEDIVSTHPTGTGPSGPPTNASKYIQIKTRVEQLKQKMESLKQ